MLPTERISYSPITERPPLKLPGGARMVVWVIVNIEEWDPKETMPRTVLTPPAGGSPSPDIPNWAWHEYGNRVGFWRMVETLDNLSIKASLAINGKAVQSYEPIRYMQIPRIQHGCWRWWCIPTSWARRTGSAISAKSWKKSPVVRTCCSGPANRSWIGINRKPARNVGGSHLTWVSYRNNNHKLLLPPCGTFAQRSHKGGGVSWEPSPAVNN